MERDADYFLNCDQNEVFNILIATDIHLGYAEKDPIRGEDSFRSFEEVLQNAINLDVDFILLGGDLFHDNKPSPYCVYKCTDLLKKYCFGEKEINMHMISRSPPSLFNDTLNYEDPNLNISYPVFSIHGNHDDPTGDKQVSTMDLLASSGLVNYFGKWNSFNEVIIEPILLTKGQNTISLFGLSHVKDERLSRMFYDEKVKFRAIENNNDMLNLLVWHQNRAHRGHKNFIPDNILPSFLDLVIWGHEHDVRIRPEMQNNGVYICQPGSTVATSLSVGEAGPKYCALLKIHKKDFYLEPIELETVRPFVFADLELDPPPNDNPTEEQVADAAMEQVSAKIDEMLTNLVNQGKTDMLPLIRVNVRYSDERQMFNLIRFGLKYTGKVANPKDMVKIQLGSKEMRKTGPKLSAVSGIDADYDMNKLKRVEDYVSANLNDGKDLQFIPVRGMNAAITKMIESNDKDAPASYLKEISKTLLQKMQDDQPNINDVEIYLNRWKTATENENRDLDEAMAILDNPNRERPQIDLNGDDSIDDLEPIGNSTQRSVDLNTSTESVRGRGRGSRGGRPRGGRTRGRGRRAALA